MSYAHRIECERLRHALSCAQQRIAELEEQKGQWVAWAKEGCAIADDLKAEIARRDAAVGEPVYQVGTDGHWYDCKEYIYREAKERRDACRILYTAAQPSTLPPEMINADAPDHYSSEETFAWVSGANWMRDQSKALGCKAIKLPEPYDDGHGNEWIPRSATIQTLKALGFTLEGE